MLPWASAWPPSACATWQCQLLVAAPEQPRARQHLARRVAWPTDGRRRGPKGRAAAGSRDRRELRVLFRLFRSGMAMFAGAPAAGGAEMP
eukprot:358937-Chlamydomonas_euryale.AAC.22